MLQATQNIPTPCCRLHIAFLQIFENGHYAADQVYFYESNLKKNRPPLLNLLPYMVSVTVKRHDVVVAVPCGICPVLSGC